MLHKYDAVITILVYLFSLTNPVTPILSLLVIVRVEVKVRQDHLDET